MYARLVSEPFSLIRRIVNRLAAVRQKLTDALKDGGLGLGSSLMLGKMAADGIGGPKDHHLAESCFLPVCLAVKMKHMFCLFFYSRNMLPFS